MTKPSINWDHVAPDYKWLARDSDGDAFLYMSEPHVDFEDHELGWWNTAGDAIHPAAFASYTPGTCDWKDSLVKRPEA